MSLIFMILFNKYIGIDDILNNKIQTPISLVPLPESIRPSLPSIVHHTTIVYNIMIIMY